MQGNERHAKTQTQTISQGGSVCQEVPTKASHKKQVTKLVKDTDETGSISHAGCALEQTHGS